MLDQPRCRLLRTDSVVSLYPPPDAASAERSPFASTRVRPAISDHPLTVI